MVLFVGASGRTPIYGRAPARPYNPRRARNKGAVREPSLQVRCNDEVEAQRRGWTFYETIKFRL